MKSQPFAILIIAIFTTLISGCTQDNSLRTNIPGLDLSKIQSEEYFRQNLDASRQFFQWCKDSMVPPIPEDKTSQMFLKNCRLATSAVLIPTDSLVKTRKHKSYGLIK